MAVLPGKDYTVTLHRSLAFTLVAGLIPLLSAAQTPAPDAAAGAARLDAAVAALPVGLPSKKGGLREFTYAFGKRSTATKLATLAEDALIDRAYFDRRADESEADYRLVLTLDRARSSQEDFAGWQSRSSTYEVSAKVGFRWVDAEGATVSEGEVDGFARVSLAGSPGKPDAARAWAQLIDESVSRAFSTAFEAAAFGNAPPPAGGWIRGARQP